MSDTSQFTWVTAESPPGSQFPKWKRSACIDAEGNVFIPATVSGVSEKIAFLCASFDGVPAVVDSGHVYLPARWIAENYPDEADVCELIERVVRECHAKETAS